MPALGVAMSEGVLVRWMKAAGDAVTEGEPIMEIETDKSTIEIPSPAAGVVGPLLFEPGALVPVGVAMTHVIETTDAGPFMRELGGPMGRHDPVEPEIVDGRLALNTATRAVQPNERVPHRLSPRERRLARERDRDSRAKGLTAGGRHRELIAMRVAESWRTIPHFAVSREVDAAAMIALRLRHDEDRPSFTVLMIKGLALALRERGEPGAIDVGLAVATPDGVAIPVIRGVLALDLSALRRETDAAISRARNARLHAADLGEPPRSTLSNLGPLGIDSFTGIIALGQMSLLTVGRIRPRPTVIGAELSVGDMFVATLNIDHRVLDGSDAAYLLTAFAAAVEDGERLEGEVQPA